MKQYQKKAVAKGLAILMLCASQCGCTQSQEEAPVMEDAPQVNTSVTSVEAAAILSDISTTQYFTQQAVDHADVETIVQAGINAPSAMNGQPWHFSVITDVEVLQQISDGMGGRMGFGGMRPSSEGDMELPEGMTPPEGMGNEMPEGFDGTMPEGGFPGGMNGEPPEGMEMPEGMEIPGNGEVSAAPAMPGGNAGGMSKAGITDAPLVIVISCKDGSELDAGLACQNMSATAQLLGYGTKIISSPTIALNGSEQDTYRELLGIPEEYSAAAILLIGYEDTSVDENIDGYTGVTSRNNEEDMVTYICSE